MWYGGQHFISFCLLTAAVSWLILSSDVMRWCCISLIAVFGRCHVLPSMQHYIWLWTGPLGLTVSGIICNVDPAVHVRVCVMNTKLHLKFTKKFITMDSHISDEVSNQIWSTFQQIKQYFKCYNLDYFTLLSKQWFCFSFSFLWGSCGLDLLSCNKMWVGRMGK